MPNLHFFDPESVERPTPQRPWRAICLAAFGAALILTACWEVFWRGRGFEAGDFNNTNALWADARRNAVGDATVMIGSSRILFDIDLDIWEEISGVRPVQLALEGTSPRIFLKDLAEDEKFKGLVIVGVTAPIFFPRDGGQRAGALKYAREQSLAQRADQILMLELEKRLAFIDEQTRLKRQFAIWPFPLREGMKPRFDPRKLETLGPDRNAQMWARVENDARYQDEARQQWLIGFQRLAPPPGPDGKPAAMPDAAIDAVIAEVKANVDKIRARGGDVAFMRLPYTGPWQEMEDGGFPRQRFWDRLIAGVDAAGVTFQDYPELQGYILPEWSHLSASEAERYTRAVTPIFYRSLEQRRSVGN